MKDRINGIREKLTKKGIKLCPVMSEEEIIDFEQAHRIELPNEYRLFISKIGNGGKGPPHYGLVPLGNLPHDMDEMQKIFYSKYMRIGKPFPFTKSWIWEDGLNSVEGNHEDLSNGNLFLGTDGCGIYWYLIVTGKDRGIPWMICGEGAHPVCPKRDFLQWYEDWLDGKDSFYGFTCD